MDTKELAKEIKIKVKKAVNEAEEIGARGLYWVKEHRDGVTLGLSFFTATVSAVAGVTKQVRRRNEQRYRDTTMYDRSIGRYLRLNRKPTKTEITEISLRKAHGERLATILDDMRLLKR